MLTHRERLPERLAALIPPEVGGKNIRHHGDFNLGRILIVKDDVFIIDFEGEPRRTGRAPRKAPAARDVAGMIRSIDYSANAALERALKMAPDDHDRLLTELYASGLRTLRRPHSRGLSRSRDKGQ